MGEDRTMAEDGGGAAAGGGEGGGETPEKKKKKRTLEDMTPDARQALLDTLPQARDRFGNAITADTQFGGGPGGTRSYPGASGVAGGYFQSYGQLARELKHDPDVFARSGGYIGKKGPFSAASRKLLDLEAEEEEVKKKSLLKWPGSIKRA
jgi:hypothetical protein